MAVSLSGRYTGKLTEDGKNAFFYTIFGQEHLDSLILMLLRKHVSEGESVSTSSEIGTHIIDESGSVVPTGYHRVRYESVDGWTTGEPGTFYNIREISFPTALIDWPTVVGWAFLDAEESKYIAVGKMDMTVYEGETMTVDKYQMGFRWLDE